MCKSFHDVLRSLLACDVHGDDDVVCGHCVQDFITEDLGVDAPAGHVQTRLGERMHPDRAVHDWIRTPWTP